MHLSLLLLPLNSCFFSPVYGISSPFVFADPSIEHLCVFFQFTDFLSFFSCWSFHWTLVCFLPIYRFLLLLFLLIHPSIELLVFLPISGFLLQFFLLMILQPLNSFVLFQFPDLSISSSLIVTYQFESLWICLEHRRIEDHLQPYSSYSPLTLFHTYYFAHHRLPERRACLSNQVDCDSCWDRCELWIQLLTCNDLLAECLNLFY